MIHSYGTRPAGWIGFFDPGTGQHETPLADDERAAARLGAHETTGRTTTRARER